MFASTHKENFLRYVCGSMVMKVRDDLIKGDFSRCLRLLQSYPPTNVDEILEASRSLWIYESQVTLACHRGGITLNQALHAIQPPHGIIMAFGLKGGYAPTLSEQMHDAAAVVQEKVEQTTSGLFSRAKRFLMEKAVATSDNGKDASNEVTDSQVIEETRDVQSPDVNLMGEPVAHPRLRHRIWNAWGRMSSATTPSHSQTPAANDAEDEKAEHIVDDCLKESSVPSVPPMKPRAWNRGRTESYGKSIESVETKRTTSV
jgi:hypothetical protein